MQYFTDQCNDYSGVLGGEYPEYYSDDDLYVDENPGNYHELCMCMLQQCHIDRV